MLSATVRILAASAVLAGVAYGIWHALDDALGRSLVAQIASLGAGLLVGIGAYAAAVWALRVEEARQIARLLGARFRRA
jgi:putative peptidoglycan lipid II flippase